MIKSRTSVLLFFNCDFSPTLQNKNMPDFDIRPATEHDLETILEIYNQEVLHGTATWNRTAFDLNYFKIWFKQLKNQNFPVFVVEDRRDQRVAGYACYDQFRSIQDFQHTVEHSVFLNPDYAGQGLGSILLKYLIEEAQAQQLHIMVAAIDSENISSIRLHEKLGFVQSAYMPQVGQKFGQWRDLVLLQLNLEQAEVTAL